MSIIKNEFNQHVQVSLETLKTIEKSLESSAITCMNALSKGNKILLCGNGGSAADAQHIAAELVGRYKTERRGLPAIALTTDTSTITSIANDFGYSKIFERQVEAIANKGDVLIGISTGGTSLNVISALKIAKNLECKTIGLSGKGGGNFNDICDINIIVPSDDTARIQEMHILIGHTICHFIDQKN